MARRLLGAGHEVVVVGDLSTGDASFVPDRWRQRHHPEEPAGGPSPGGPGPRAHRREGLFVNDGFTSRIVGLRPEESRRTLEFLFDHVTKPEYTVRFKWEPGSVAFWDNRVTSHLGPQDIDHLEVDRTLHRVTLIGDVPVGVDGRESELIEGTPFRAAPVFDARHVSNDGSAENLTGGSS